MAQSEYIFDSVDKTFADEVIIKSDDIPILVDFWAPWCGPCRMLAPVLDQLAEHFKGKLLIAKVNTDENPGVSQHFQIRGIPALKLFKGREVVFETGGVQPLANLIEGIAPFISTESEDDASTENISTETPDALESDNIDSETLSAADAVAQLGELVAANPDNAELNLNYVMSLVANEQYDDAKAHYTGLSNDIRDTEQGQQTNVFLDFARARAQAPSVSDLDATLEKNPEDLTARYQIGVNKLLQGQQIEALDDFLFIVKKDSEYEDGLGRKALVAAFALVNNEDVVRDYRRQMASYLN